MSYDQHALDVMASPPLAPPAPLVDPDSLAGAVPTVQILPRSPAGPTSPAGRSEDAYGDDFEEASEDSDASYDADFEEASAEEDGAPEEIMEELSDAHARRQLAEDLGADALSVKESLDVLSFLTAVRASAQSTSRSVRVCEAVPKLGRSTT